MNKPEDVYRALRDLPERERLRVVERVIHELVGEAQGGAVADLVGLWRTDADVVDAVIQGAMEARERRRLRSADG